MNGMGAFVLAVAVLIVLVLFTVAAAVAYVSASRVSARRPWLPYEDRPPVGLRKLRSADVSREVEAGIATWIGYLRRRTVQN
jgi:hypothetical protein